MTMKKFKQALSEALETAKTRFDWSNRDQKDLSALFPRYVRINLNKISLEDALEAIDKVGGMDDNVPNLLVFPTGTTADLYNNPLVSDRKLILQDKSSCIPAAVLNPPADSIVLDACSAPGNKTSHLSAIMDGGKGGLIRALEISPPRFKLLTQNMADQACGNVQTFMQSFLDDQTLADFADTEFILLDPSCSGSGIVNQMERNLDRFDLEFQAKQPDRLKSLADFQLKCLNRSMEFPNVKKIVYSTCSIHREENEDVVEKALMANPHFDLCTFPSSFHSLPGYDPKGMLRMDPTRDKTNGFFVALFIRNGRERVLQRDDITIDVVTVKKEREVAAQIESRDQRKKKKKQRSRSVPVTQVKKQ